MSTILLIGLIQRSRMVRAVYSKWLTARQNLPITVTVEANDEIQYIRKTETLEKELLPNILVFEACDATEGEVSRIARLKKEFPEVKILVIATLTEGKAVMDMVKAGADGYLTTDAEPEDLLEALKTMLHQGHCYPDWVIGALVRHLRDTESGMPPPHGESGVDLLMSKYGPRLFVPVEKHTLSEREKLILSLVASGATYADIAKQLSISVRTVQVHVYNLCRKFQVNNRMGLVMQVLKNNNRLS